MLPVIYFFVNSSNIEIYYLILLYDGFQDLGITNISALFPLFAIAVLLLCLVICTLDGEHISDMNDMSSNCQILCDSILRFLIDCLKVLKDGMKVIIPNFKAGKELKLGHRA